ncbi:nucleoside phosphorylase [Clostridium bowmanii]|uniref:nucleoside phosphorylase n=1 Tax=Clostridium bowmanii TaxID=132925 RepID=UPI001C0E54E2|nr:nucleoside phosphorylase [Clostridium bowmanii]MBU3191868.1 nucleoside phosphorylase [Clostridium bowmanii]MCA1076142.1 nucleoside phosphorylase [Clostridium bowmanii]
MLEQRQYPILEFDSCSSAVIEPLNFIKSIDMAECCVISFFRDIIEMKNNNGQLKQVETIHSETLDIPIYETMYNGKRVALVLGFLGSAGSAALLEELIAFGCKKFIVCGGAGVLQKDIAVGHLIIPTSAVRDEGVSYHYIEPSREVECNKEIVEVIEREFNKDGIKYLKAKTWTTDALYRETKEKVSLRISEGCVTVEMEAAAFFAVAKFRNVALGQILYCGDDLSGDEWDERLWNGRKDIRENLVDLSIKICSKL